MSSLFPVSLSCRSFFEMWPFFRETSLINEHMHIPDINFTSLWLCLWLCLWLILSEALVLLKTPHLHPDAVVNGAEEDITVF